MVAFYIPVYNSEKSVINALSSILAQETSYDFCITLLDDYSSDSTFEILQRYVLEIPNVRLYRNESNSGVLLTTKKVRELALTACPNSEYIVLGSDHDYWDPDFLNLALASFKKYPQASFFIPDFSDSAGNNNKKFRNSNEPIRFIEGKLALASCKAGKWIYGVEKKNLKLKDFFYLPIVGPDQAYMYPIVYKFGVILSSAKLLHFQKGRLIAKNKPMFHLISKKYYNSIRLKGKNRLSRSFYISNVLIRNRKIYGFDLLASIAVSFQIFLKINKVSSIKYLLKKGVKQILFKSLNSYLRVYTKFKLLAIENFYSYKVLTGKRLLYAFPKPKNIKLAIFVSSPGIIRLVENPLRMMLEANNCDICLIASEKSWKKKLTPEHMELVNELIGKYKNLRIQFLPKLIENALTIKSKLLKYDQDRLFLNSWFYSNPELKDETIAATRSLRGLGTLSNPSNNWNLETIVSTLKKKYSLKSLQRYFIEMGFDLIICSPVVNVPETEVLALSLDSSIKKIAVVASWDNLTVKGLQLDIFDKYLVWGPEQKRQAHSLHNIAEDKIEYLGPYAFFHLEKFKEAETSDSIEKILWVCSSAFIVDAKKDSKFIEIDDIADMINALSSEFIKFEDILTIRLHPNCGYSIDEAVTYINNKLDNANLSKTNFEKKEPITFTDRKYYVQQIQNSRLVMGYATTAIVEAAILGKKCLGPATERSRRSFQNLFHGKYLLEDNGGPVKVLENYDELLQILNETETQNYTPNGSFYDLIGLETNISKAAENFCNEIWKSIIDDK